MTATETPLQNYLRLWRGLGRDLGFTLATLPIVIVSFAVIVTGLSLSVGLAIVYLGIPLLALTLLTGRWFAAVELARLRAAGRPSVAPPDWTNTEAGAGLTRRVLHVIADARYWVRALHAGVVNPVIGIATWSITITWLAVALGGPTYWYWGRWVEVAEPGSPVAYPIMGVVAIGTLPTVIHALVSVHDSVARRMLGESQSTALRRAATRPEIVTPSSSQQDIVEARQATRW
jgi:Putative sensor